MAGLAKAAQAGTQRQAGRWSGTQGGEMDTRASKSQQGQESQKIGWGQGKKHRVLQAPTRWKHKLQKEVQKSPQGLGCSHFLCLLAPSKVCLLTGDLLISKKSGRMLSRFYYAVGFSVIRTLPSCDTVIGMQDFFRDRNFYADIESKYKIN